MADRPAKVQDEIELIDVLRVIWKWKYLILVGTLIFALIAAVISLNSPQNYRVNMVLQPGVVGIDARGRQIYIDSPQNIKALIEAGAFNLGVSDHLKNPNSSLPKLLKFKVNIPKESDSMVISYEDSNVDLALTILKHLEKQVLKKYDEVVQKYRDIYESEILFKKNKLSEIEYENKVSIKHIGKVKNRINELLLETEEIDAKIKSIMNEKSKYISGGNKQENIMATILYNDLIQQLTTMKTIYKNEIDGYFMRIETENYRQKDRQNKTDIILAEIRNIENKMNSIQNMQVIKPPTGSRRPVRPKTKLNIILASVVGLVIMLFLVFFLEYLSKHKNMKYQ
jgi:hypothetical protein